MKIEDQYDHMLNQTIQKFNEKIIEYPKVMLTILRKLHDLHSDRFALMHFEDSAVFQDGILILVKNHQPKLLLVENNIHRLLNHFVY